MDMPLCSLLESTAETLQDLVLAADERYWEGYELAVQGHSYAGIYSCGYAAEMLLKVASFRFDGALPGEPIGPRLIPAKKFGGVRLPAVPYEAAHSVRFWATYLETKRADAGRPFAPPLQAMLTSTVDRIHSRWWVSMRYRASTFMVGHPLSVHTETLTLLEDVDWLRKNHSSLWS